MYKILHINGEDYKFEFSVEASLYSDCVQKITNIMVDINSGQESSDMKRILAGFSDVPSTAVTCFFAGLLEHHGMHEDGDSRVPNLRMAKKLAISMIRDENSGIDNWYDIFTLCTEQMGEDGFFELIGLGEMLGERKKRPIPIPQDHKKKSKTKTETSDT